MAFTRRINVRGIIYQDGKIFAQKLKNSDRDYEYWCTPGGGLDDGESLVDGLRREMIEETGIEPKIGWLLFIQQYQDESKEYLEFFFHIENADDYKTIDLATTSHGEIEVDRCEFIDPTTENILPAPLQTMDYEKYLGYVQPVLVMNQFDE